MPQIRGVFRKNRYFLTKNVSFYSFLLGRGDSGSQKVQRESENPYFHTFVTSDLLMVHLKTYWQSIGRQPPVPNPMSFRCTINSWRARLTIVLETVENMLHLLGSGVNNHQKPTWKAMCRSLCYARGGFRQGLGRPDTVSQTPRQKRRKNQRIQMTITFYYLNIFWRSIYRWKALSILFPTKSIARSESIEQKSRNSP